MSDAIRKALEQEIGDGLMEAHWRPQAIDDLLALYRAVLAEQEWQPMKSAPFEQPIEVKMPLYKKGSDKIVGTWVATAVLHRDNDEGHWTDGVSILHYNGDTLVAGFKGQLTGWRTGGET